MNEKYKDTMMQQQQQQQQQTQMNHQQSKTGSSMENASNAVVKDLQVRTSKGEVFRLFHGQNQGRPQMFFKDKVDNSNNTPFVPLIRNKPNAKNPMFDCK